MGTTRVSINGRDFLINDSLTYAEIDGARPEVMGLLMNARFIQAVFDDKAGRERFNRFGRIFDPEENTNGLIKALPDWYNAGLRAITVGFQGGGTCYTINSQTIDNNPFGSDGRHLDPAYASRMDRLIRACDRIGMVVIVSFFYWMQALRFSNENALLEAMKTACAFLRERKYTNVLIEIANEHDIFDFQHLSIVRDPSRMAGLIRIARDESGSLPVGCSGSGGKIFREICDESDFILIHGNGCSRQILYNLIQTVREWAPDKPVVCNEDSAALGQIPVAVGLHASWGYYNNITKQEPPVDWEIQPGEDTFFTMRMSMALGIPLRTSSVQQYFLQGLEHSQDWNGLRWIRLACLYPEEIDYVEFFKNGSYIFTAYDEPFVVNAVSNWDQKGVDSLPGDEWTAIIHTGGKTVELSDIVR